MLSRIGFAVLLFWWAALSHGGVAAATELTFDRPETVGICGFRPMWDESVPLAADGAVVFTDDVIKDRHPTAAWAAVQRGDQPGALAFDALRRSLLVRFPGAAEQVAAKLAEGYRIERAELVLPFRDTELWPPHGKDFWEPAWGGYTARRNWGVDRLYRENPPTWHAVVWALRRPWSADPDVAPTFNAYIAGAGYWERFGATSETADRFPQRFGPTEISARSPGGRVDVTAVVNEPEFGRTPGERLRVLCDQGFLVQKWETYDHRYFTGVYEWATACGGRGILIQTPKLVVTLARDSAAPGVDLPASVDVKRLADELRRSGRGGRPTAVMLSEAELRQLDRRLQRPPQGMPAWQWERVQQLYGLRSRPQGDRVPIEMPMFFDFLLEEHVIYNLVGTRERRDEGWVRLPGTPMDRYAAWIDQILARQPRGWAGFNAARELTQWYRFHEALPGPAEDAIREYWTAWLMPDRPTAATHALRMDRNYIEGPLVHPMADQLAAQQGTADAVGDTYWRKTGDWRGNKSFYRSGFNYTISTQNFNTSAAAGALLGGAIIDAELAMADGRHGVENYPLGLWSWRDGSSQEHLDHYYFPITMSGNKAVFDFGPTAYDRMLGRSLMAFNVEELVSAYHPGLRRLIAPSTRTSVDHFLFQSDGLYHILHTLSPQGALMDLHAAEGLPRGARLLGREVPPTVIANQTVTQPWAADWVARLVDEKPLPFTARHSNGDHLRTTFLGANYGLASVDRAQPHTSIMAQWRREPRVVDRVQQLGTLFLRFGVNETRWVNDASGYIAPRGSIPALQHRNKLLVVSSPFRFWHGPGGVGRPGSGQAEEIRSLQTSLAVMSYEQPQPQIEVYVDGRRVERLPATARQGQRIALRDGIAYLGVIPLPATDLGRDVEVVIEPGAAEVFDHVEIAPALVIHSYFLRRDRPLEHGKDDFEAIDRGYGGFAVEMSDAAEHGDFAAFLRHMQQARCKVEWDQSSGWVIAEYSSGSETLTARRPTQTEEEPRGLRASEWVCTIGGEAAGLPPGIQRDTDCSQIGNGGSLAKGGAQLHHTAGVAAYLQWEPRSKVYRAMLPTTQRSDFTFRLPEGETVKTSGPSALLEVVWRSAERTLEVYHAARPDAAENEPAPVSLLLSDFRSPPKVMFAGRQSRPRPTTIDGKSVLVVPLPTH